jgi:hypothetical protein
MGVGALHITCLAPGNIKQVNALKVYPALLFVRYMTANCTTRLIFGT